MQKTYLILYIICTTKKKKKITKKSTPSVLNWFKKKIPIVKKIQEQKEVLGHSHLVVRMQFPGTDPEKVARSLRLFSEEIIPKFPDGENSFS